MIGYKEYYKMLEEKAKTMTDKQQEKLFRKELKKFGVKDLEDLTPEQKKKFFNKIDSLIDAKKETD